MKKQYFKYLTLAGIGALCLAGPASAAPILSETFEGSLGGFSLTGNGQVTTYATYSGAGLTTNPGDAATYGNGLFTFNNGNTAPNAVLTESFATVVGQTYTVSFSYGNFNLASGTTTQSIVASAYDGTGTGGTLLNFLTATDTVTGSNVALDTIYGSPFTFTFVASSGTSTLAFADQLTSTTAQSDGLLDNVLVTGAAVTSVPEIDPKSAATPVALGISLLLIAADRRRKATV